MISRRRLLASLIAGSLLLSVTACTTGTPGNGGVKQNGAIVTSTPPTNSAAVAVVAVPKSAPIAPTRRPSYDPVLASGDWGVVSRSEAGITDSDARTSVKHQVIKQGQINTLTAEQSENLLATLERSDVVDGLIEKNGGSVSQTHYFVREIFADADTGVDTPWVTATLRADFPAVGGLKGVELRVIQQKTSKGLDDHPYVISTLVGFVADTTSASDPTTHSFGAPLLNPKSLRFK